MKEFEFQIETLIFNRLLDLRETSSQSRKGRI
jgi:hypothetical protein